jgi:hypothetical protein
MEFGLDGSQRSLKEDARKFVARNCPIAEVRRLIETEHAYDADLWAKMAAQGYVETESSRSPPIMRPGRRARIRTMLQ